MKNNSKVELRLNSQKDPFHPGNPLCHLMLPGNHQGLPTLSLLHSQGQVPTSPMPFQSGKWTNKEQRKYIKFIEEHLDQLSTKERRKQTKIFKMMSEMVRSRTADQCRSHHQKLCKYNDSVQDIIREYKTAFESRTAPTVSFQQGRNEMAPSQINGGFCVIKGNNNSLKIVIKTDRIETYSPFRLLEQPPQQ